MRRVKADDSLCFCSWEEHRCETSGTVGPQAPARVSAQTDFLPVFGNQVTPCSISNAKGLKHRSDSGSLGVGCAGV